VDAEARVPVRIPVARGLVLQRLGCTDHSRKLRGHGQLGMAILVWSDEEGRMRQRSEGRKKEWYGRGRGGPMGFVVQRRFVCAMFLAPPSIKKYQVEYYPARRPMAV
jgi:hypothetical protein